GRRARCHRFVPLCRAIRVIRAPRRLPTGTHRVSGPPHDGPHGLRGRTGHVLRVDVRGCLTRHTNPGTAVVSHHEPPDLVAERCRTPFFTTASNMLNFDAGASY